MASVSISCPSCSATDGVVRNGKSTAGHQRYLCSHCRKTWQLQFAYTASQPGTHQKIIYMAMKALDAGQLHALWALASTRFYVT
ncbi:IS1 ORF1 [Shigella sonnei]|nr:IS1 ORF1 [Shigella sonnei]